MNWDALGATGEIVGALAVLLTLVYLATQIKQSNDISRFNASKEIMNQFNEINRLVATDSSIRHLLMKSGELSVDEREQLYNFAMMFCNIWQTIQSAYDSGQVDVEFYAAGKKDVLVEVDRWPNFRSAVEDWLSNYPEFSDLEIFRSLRDA